MHYIISVSNEFYLINDLPNGPFVSTDSEKQSIYTPQAGTTHTNRYRCTYIINQNKPT